MLARAASSAGPAHGQERRKEGFGRVPGRGPRESEGVLRGHREGPSAQAGTVADKRDPPKHRFAAPPSDGGVSQGGGRGGDVTKFGLGEGLG